MRVLSFDTTTRAGSLAMVDDHGAVLLLEGDGARSHAERLPADALDLLRRAGVTLADIDAFAVVSGPGGFTGLRVGIAAVQGLAFVTGRRIVPVPTLLAMAASVADRLAPGQDIGVWMDARRGELFAGRWRVTDAAPGSPGHLQEIEATTLCRPDAMAGQWRATPPALIVGDGATLYAPLAGSVAPVAAALALAPAAGRLALSAAAAGLAVDPAGVQPVYVRRPDAEVARDERDRKASGTTPWR